MLLSGPGGPGPTARPVFQARALLQATLAAHRHHMSRAAGSHYSPAEAFPTASSSTRAPQTPGNPGLGVQAGGDQEPCPPVALTIKSLKSSFSPSLQGRAGDTSPGAQPPTPTPCSVPVSHFVSLTGRALRWPRRAPFPPIPAGLIFPGGGATQVSQQHPDRLWAACRTLTHLPRHPAIGGSVPQPGLGMQLLHPQLFYAAGLRKLEAAGKFWQSPGIAQCWRGGGNGRGEKRQGYGKSSPLASRDAVGQS